MAELPAVNSLLQVVVRDDLVFPSRVEDIQDRTLVIAAPIGRGDVEVPPDGRELEVFWTGPRTRYQVRAQMAGLTRDWPPRWHLRAVSEPTRQTRRRFVRGAGGGAVIITTSEESEAPALGAEYGYGSAIGIDLGYGAADDRAPGGEVAQFEGFIVDLSEAGARCRVRTAQTELIVGEPVLVEMTVGDKRLQVEATVLSVCASGVGTDLDVVVTYEPPERDAQVIRQHVLQWEISQRGRARGRGSRTVPV